MPQRIQRRRTARWTAPDCTCGCGRKAIYVGRPSQWGNPINLSDVGAQFPSLDDRQVATLVVRDFRVLARRGELHFPNWRFLGGERGPVHWFYPTVDQIRAELAGHDLMCWCPLDSLCHADVLLELANGGSA